MRFDWSEYLSVAQELCRVAVSGQPAGLEARQRAAISRAYYSAYISARNHLRDVERITVPARANPHFFVMREFSTAKDLRRFQIGMNLDRLRSARNQCDYDDTVQHLPTLTRRSLSQAARVLAALRAFNPVVSSPPPQTASPSLSGPRSSRRRRLAPPRP
jgi:hypothetical protein